MATAILITARLTCFNTGWEMMSLPLGRSLLLHWMIWATAGLPVIKGEFKLIMGVMRGYPDMNMIRLYNY